MYERFTRRAMNVMALANMAAHQFGSDEVGSGHVLYGIAAEGVGLGALTLKGLEIDLLKLKAELAKKLWVGRSIGSSETRSLTGSAKAVIEHAIAEAKALGHNYIGSEHLMLGTVLDDGVAGDVLRARGITIEAAREAIRDLLPQAHSRDLIAEPKRPPDPSCALCSSLRSVAAGTHSRWIKSFHESHLLLGENQGCPGWCVLVLNDHVEHMAELSIVRQSRVFYEVAQVAAAVRAVFPTSGKGGGPVRINYECLGNLVGHIHWHIIPRHADDPEPTKAVWGWPEERLKGAMTEQERERLMVELMEKLRDEPRTQ